jgi:AcrR family transcriptional regulator
MATEDRRDRERAARRTLITSTARHIAEREGWDAVTTRRLSTDIEYSQPVLYKHFSSMEDIVEAVALEGFAELADVLAAARRGGSSPEESLVRLANAHATFAADNPALYDAMFTRATRLRFGAADVPTPLADGFGEMCAAVAGVAGDREVETLAEVMWAALHGMATLNRGDRLRPGHDADRIDLLVTQVCR